MMIQKKKKDKKDVSLIIREPLRICVLISSRWQIVQGGGLSSGRELVS